MCCRYYMELSPELRPIVEAAKRSALAERMVQQFGRPVKDSGEVRPTDIAPVIAPDSRGERAVFPMIWGFTLPDRPNTKRSAPLVNARVETAAVKPTFRVSWARHRCIIPAAYYYEWEHLVRPDGTKKTGDRYVIQPAGSAAAYLAGLYRIENGLPAFVVLTSKPSPDVAHIHDRMPLILPKGAVRDWVNPRVRAEDLLPYALTRLEARPER